MQNAFKLRELMGGGMQRIGLLWTSSLSRTGIHSRKAECLSICRDAFLLAIYGFPFHHRTETQSL